MTSQTLDGERIGPQLSLEELRFPAHVGEAIADVYDREERVETGAEWVSLMREISTDTRSELPTEEDLCYLDGGQHTVEIGDETSSFVCVLDPLAVPFLRGEPATIRSVTPVDGESITVDVRADGASVDAEDAVISLGAARDPDVDGPPSLEDVYTETCPYIHAFASVEEYEQWAADVDAATTSVSVETGVAVARELAENLFQ